MNNLISNSKNKRTYNQMTNKNNLSNNYTNSKINSYQINNYDKTMQNENSQVTKSINDDIFCVENSKLLKIDKIKAKQDEFHKQKLNKVKAKHEELKAKNQSRLQANKERKQKVDEERERKYRYEEMRKQAARDKVAEVSKKYQTKKPITHKLTPIKFKTHMEYTPTTMYKKIHYNLMKELKKNIIKQDLSTIVDITVDETVDKADIKTDYKSDVNFDIKTIENVETECEDKKDIFSTIASTPFNMNNNKKKLTSENLDTIFSENHSQISPIKEIKIEEKFNFSSTITSLNTENQNMQSKNKSKNLNEEIKNHNLNDIENKERRETFIIQKDKSESLINQYEMTLIDSQVSSDDDYYIQCSESNKPIPNWAKKDKIWNSISQQVIFFIL